MLRDLIPLMTRPILGIWLLAAGLVAMDYVVQGFDDRAEISRQPEPRADQQALP